MHRVIKGLVGLLAGTALFLTSSQAIGAANVGKRAILDNFKIPEEFAQKYTIQDSDIEREIRKWDDWILDFIDSKEFVKTNLWQTLGTYQKNNQRVSLQLFHKGQKDLEQQIVGVTPHELSHAFLDDTPGLLSSPFYRGPKWRELTARALKLYKSAEHGALIKQIWEDCMTVTPEEKEFLAFIGGYENILSFDDETFKCYEDSFNTFSKCDAKWFKQRLVGEITARRINSIMNVYFGPANTNLWEPDWEELAFWTRSKYNGKLVLGKGIEKCYVARQLKKKGMPWQEIQAKLEYATSYTEDDYAYSWPENNFKFKKPLKIEINLGNYLLPAMFSFKR